jgi:hypothetical protein
MSIFVFAHQTLQLRPGFSPVVLVVCSASSPCLHFIFLLVIHRNTVHVSLCTVNDARSIHQTFWMLSLSLCFGRFATFSGVGSAETKIPL